MPGESRCSQSFRCKHLRKTVQNISGRVWGSIVSDTAIKDQQIPRPRLPADCQVNQAVTTLNGSWLGDSQIQACMRLAVGLRVHSARAHGARVGICHVTKLTLLEGHGNDHDAWPDKARMVGPTSCLPWIPLWTGLRSPFSSKKEKDNSSSPDVDDVQSYLIPIFLSMLTQNSGTSVPSSHSERQ